MVFAPFVAGWKLNRRTIMAVGSSLVVFFVFAFGIWAAWFISSPMYRANWHIWLSSMQSESARHPIGLSNARPFFIYFFMAAPLIFAVTGCASNPKDAKTANKEPEEEYITYTVTGSNIPKRVKKSDVEKGNLPKDMDATLVLLRGNLQEACRLLGVFRAPEEDGAERSAAEGCGMGVARVS